MGMFDFITNPINDAFHAVVDSNPITSGISNAIHTVGENTGINDVVDKVAPLAAVAAAVYLTGGALAPEAMASLQAGAEASGLTAEEYATLVANSAPVDSAMAGATTAGDAYLPGALANASGDAFLPGALSSDAVANPSLLSQVGNAYSALPSAVQTGLSTLGKTALGKIAGSLMGGNQGSGLANYGNQDSSQGSSPSINISNPTTQSGTTNTTLGTPTAGNLFTGNPLKNTDILQKLKGMYPQLNQVNPQILNKLGYPSESPLQNQSTQVAQANPYEHLLNQDETGFKDGGHVPEFITGHTGHYADGKGDGQSDDIKALLNEGDYVMDAEAVAQLGNGSSKAGKSVLEQFRKSIPQNNHKVGGKVPAMIADGEYVLPSSFVSSLGKGDGNKGAKMLDNMRHALRDHKRSAPLNKIPPPSKSPLEYLKAGSKMKETR
jgi:hypothetical protein